jgi:uracil phosphoribosyltransferase
LLQDRLTRLRDKKTSTAEFQFTLEEAGLLMAAEATSVLPTRSRRVVTPLKSHTGLVVACDTVLVPVLRAGLSLLPAFQRLLPSASIGYIGLARDETTLLPQSYYQKLPRITKKTHVFLLDPMLATGGSSLAALELLHGKGARQIQLVCLLCAPEGISLIHRKFSHVRIITGAVDERLNDRGYIVPGLGDAGDRLFGT